MSKRLTKKYGAPLGYKVIIKHTSLTSKTNYAKKKGIITARGIPSALGKKSVGVNHGDNALLVRFDKPSDQMWFNEKLLKLSEFKGFIYMVKRSLSRILKKTSPNN